MREHAISPLGKTKVPLLVKMKLFSSFFDSAIIFIIFSGCEYCVNNFKIRYLVKWFRFFSLFSVKIVTDCIYEIIESLNKLIYYYYSKSVYCRILCR